MNSNSYKSQRNRALSRKLEIVKEKGGCCSNCGYSKNLAALDLHHLDPKIKNFQLDSRHLSNTSLLKLKEEIDKCILLCANCHREIHNPDLQIENINIIKDDSRTIARPYKGKCLNCSISFKSSKGKKFCSKECRKSYKNYPTLEQVNTLYKELKSWEKVAKYFSTTRRIIQNIRKWTPSGSN